MLWGAIWLLATAGTLASKFLTTRTILRLRRDLGKLQREYAAARQRTEEARDLCAELSRQERDRTVSVERLRRTVTEMERKILKLDEEPEEDPEVKRRIKPRRLGDYGAETPV
ncbi:MAG: hypothetical protein A3F84_17550 [Candidatus Handelsmanbacteria bacterium RIFCSPLOWO2_12_FULL_64_10]|uniref:Uncharacterized protein n=1 Tax=Handelsmanbacteria sp. (strain RIFCSPLOWO2_12_FULL_64_10) TaxID=1817868 RepID=A0A1F6CY30_HANXR|nr:MAG: hypothetical protein A3F84_17550 [Candidatus Handelsmanbacteria bacterium RIFCSPLOWO2_12_FULL_64_10]